MPDHGGNPRLDRIEGIIEALATRQAGMEDEFSRLLKAQVVMADTVQKFSERVDRYIESRQREHSEIDERFTALMRMMDEWIRNNPRP